MLLCGFEVGGYEEVNGDALGERKGDEERGREERSKHSTCRILAAASPWN